MRPFASKNEIHHLSEENSGVRSGALWPLVHRPDIIFVDSSDEGAVTRGDQGVCWHKGNKIGLAQQFIAWFKGLYPYIRWYQIYFVSYHPRTTKFGSNMSCNGPQRGGSMHLCTLTETMARVNYSVTAYCK